MDTLINKWFLLRVLTATLFVYSASACTSNHSLDLEDTICGAIKEPFVFWLWSSAAGVPDVNRIKNSNNIIDVAFRTIDGRELRGYKLSSRNNAKTKGYLLVAQGNAMIADQIIDYFLELSNAGYDVYIFDFRGYGRSGGKRRLRAILSDYRELISHLDSLKYVNRAFYGMSFGGVVLLDALKDDDANKMVVIDSAPSTLSNHGCPSEHDPVNNISKLSGASLFIFGKKDTIVPREDSLDLSERAKEIAQAVVVMDDFGHPFMDGNTSIRMKLIREFLERNELGGSNRL